MDMNRPITASTPRRTQQQIFSQPSARRTPGSRTPFTRNRPVRHNILTPGRERRRSGILPARRTPRDDLRLLSRLLKRPSPRLAEQLHTKRQSQSSLTSRSSILSGQFQDEGDDEEVPPMISATYGDSNSREEEDDDEEQLRHPPRLSVGGDEERQEDLTTYSVEFPRRMTAESRLSLDRTRLSIDNVSDTADSRTQFVIRPLRNEEIPLEDNHYDGYGDDPENPIDNQEDYEDDINRESLQKEFIQRVEQRKSDIAKLRFAAQSATQPQSRARPAKLDPVLPKKLVKDLAKNLSSLPLSVDAWNALSAASDLFFKQASSDLATYAQHANRKTIDDSDVLMLLKRQRQLTPKVTVFSLAHRYLPSELLAELRLPNVNSEKSVKEHEKITRKKMQKRQRKANKKEVS
ncbi:centromere kinetochore component CENP-T-domain-containing protein [Lipomyces kononenkoae]|uniref:Centromere kinetochore component CENP-T-domain-containing protein n=1 Tax=Lipomyces kononenkoae TaxID=34357 RepID=A0ACC3TBM0_LIPKO